MNLHTLQNRPGAIRSKKRVGQGESSGHGKTSGRGHKGQYGRSGHKFKAVFEGGQMQLIRRIPKRGFVSSVKVVFTPVNLSQLQQFAAGAVVSPETMHDAGLASGKKARIKILGTGAIERALQVKAHAFSASAKSKIEAAGGSCEVVA
ncbi:MAG: 50S ribosomal protein L15 [Kiritimatiellae bacterium]|nr:50S ribosomal protein L15 [Kiritimatiellia bacterium]